MDILRVDGGPLYQWDKGRRLKILPVQNCAIKAVHFVNPDGDTALVVEVKTEGDRMYAPIPNILLTYQWDIKAYAVMTTAEGDITVCKDAFNIRKRQKPADYVYTETEVISIETVVKKAFDEARGDFVPRMRNIDQNRIKAYEEDGGYYFSESNWKAFIGDEVSGKFGYNRVYVERSKERGTYGMYALSENAEPIYNAWYSKQEWAERFAAEHPGEEFREPYDIEYPLLDSIVQRQEDGNIYVPLTPKDDRHAVPLKLLREMNEKIASMNDTIKGMQNELFAGTEGLAYTLSKDGTHYICTGLGDVPAGSDIELASYIDGVPVEEIGADAFKNIQINSIRIPTTLNKFGSQAFGWSGPVGAVYIKDLAKWAAAAFESSSTPVTAAHPKVYIKGIYRTDLVIPDGVTVIKTRAFVHWVQFTSLKLPETVTTIQSMAFQYCSRLESVTIPASVKGIYGSAFGFCSGLKSFTFEGKPTMIETTAFQNCTALTDIYVPWEEGEVKGAPWGASNASVHYKRISTVGLAYTLSSDGTYYICSGEGTATVTGAPDIVIASYVNGIPVTEIGKNAFDQNEFTSISIPSTIKRIEEGAFANTYIPKLYIYDLTKWCHIERSMSAASKYTIPADSTSPMRMAVSGQLYLDDVSVSSVIIPDGTRYIGAYSFNNCNNITKVTIPDSVESIGYQAFYKCRNLSSVDLGSGIRSIDGMAFYFCSGLTKITVPDSITHIDHNAFGSSSIKNIYCDWVWGDKPDVEKHSPWGATNAILHFK